MGEEMNEWEHNEMKDNRKLVRAESDLVILKEGEHCPGCLTRTGGGRCMTCEDQRQKELSENRPDDLRGLNG